MKWREENEERFQADSNPTHPRPTEIQLWRECAAALNTKCPDAKNNLTGEKVRDKYGELRRQFRTAMNRMIEKVARTGGEGGEYVEEVMRKMFKYYDCCRDSFVYDSAVLPPLNTVMEAGIPGNAESIVIRSIRRTLRREEDGSDDDGEQPPPNPPLPRANGPPPPLRPVALVTAPLRQSSDTASRAMPVVRMRVEEEQGEEFSDLPDDQDEQPPITATTATTTTTSVTAPDLNSALRTPSRPASSLSEGNKGAGVIGSVTSPSSKGNGSDTGSATGKFEPGGIIKRKRNAASKQSKADEDPFLSLQRESVTIMRTLAEAVSGQKRQRDDDAYEELQSQVQDTQEQLREIKDMLSELIGQKKKKK